MARAHDRALAARGAGAPGRALTTALADLGEPEPTAMAELVHALIMQAARDRDPSTGLGQREVLGLLRRLLDGYLNLSARR